MSMEEEKKLPVWCAIIQLRLIAYTLIPDLSFQEILKTKMERSKME